MSSNEINKPINQRIFNETSEFEYTKYIDRQVTRFMERSALNGVSIAVVKDEKLVFNRSYGYANVELGIETSPEHLFRIASVSKLITAIAVMKLVDDGLLSLNDPVFGKDGFFNDEKYLKIRDEKLLSIEVLHLLNHTSGWTQRYGDPMFNSLTIAKKVGDEAPATIDSYLKFVTSRRLYYKPGTMYGYSNMAYVFLGEIIKKASGMSYENYIRYQILFPNGIYDMHLGKNFYADKLPNEVRYYEQEGSMEVKAYNGNSIYLPKSYGGNDIELLGAAGGWVVSASEMAKLMTLVDGFEDTPDILTKESIENMTGGLGNPLGWRETVRGYWTRTGSFAGTAAVVQRRPDGTQWVFLSNTSNWKGPGFSNDIKRLMRKLQSRVKYWPDQDLF
ncbi:MAG: serine hydrolase, partial [Prolixibacteraceae bacterium]|nr:serine hydrolase [Prolixibacteraceae bacterium]